MFLLFQVSLLALSQTFFFSPKICFSFPILKCLFLALSILWENNALHFLFIVMLFCTHETLLWFISYLTILEFEEHNFLLCLQNNNFLEVLLSFSPQILFWIMLAFFIDCQNIYLFFYGALFIKEQLSFITFSIICTIALYIMHGQVLSFSGRNWRLVSQRNKDSDSLILTLYKDGDWLPLIWW